MKKITALLVLTLLTLSGCKTKLNQQSATESPLKGTKWILVEMMGKPIPSSQNGKDIYVYLDTNEDRINGHSGCNGFGGNYELTDGNRIAFSKMMGTMMACADMETETQFLKLMQTVDNYNLNGNSLQLNRARMAPLLKFEAEKK
ncbi:hypothetical protein FSS13T_21030 [Flavobacterium saliperosum S13]|uniref:Heat shock protein HslJ n=2 Tax=Flavobacterium saliperosum TaxID=329186 RepID=A0A1G4VR01_9FLAO|nr:META domain-containing protein [Flavobacterium saliperosum]ESU24130.1 hypothetical protein FSS13T_21030 [Flavobacterium saliperosum S13]SCX10578.1 Heat shock protein HslJ [Flavobacterium saliperosum]